MALDWRRAKAPKPTEDAIGEGFVRKNGEVTPKLPKDSLAKRAAAEEAKWMRENGLEIGRKGYITTRKQRRARY